MPSRASVFILLSSCMAGAWAAEPTGLERLAATLPGTWKTEGQTFDTAISKNGPQHYVTVRDCWRTDSAVKCVFIVNGVLEHYSIYSWDAANNLYQETPITGRGKQPEVHIGVKGNVWTYDQDTQDRDGWFEAAPTMVMLSTEADTAMHWLRAVLGFTTRPIS